MPIRAGKSYGFHALCLYYARKNTPYGGIFGISFRKNTPYSSIWGSISHNYSPDETINPRNMPIYGHIWQIYCRKQVFLSMYARQK